MQDPNHRTMHHLDRSRTPLPLHKQYRDLLQSAPCDTYDVKSWVRHPLCEGCAPYLVCKTLRQTNSQILRTAVALSCRNLELL